MTITDYDLFYKSLTSFLLCSYAVGWMLVARHAMKRWSLNVCQFVQKFIFSPFLVVAAGGIGFLLLIFGIVIIINFLIIVKCLLILITTLAILGAVGHFVIVPAANKITGATKPFSDKICITLYKRKF